MDNKKKPILTFKEFLESRRKEQPKSLEKQVDWNARKAKWLNSIENLYKIVDDIIVKNLKDAGYNIVTKKEESRIFEDYIGAYSVSNYSIKTDQFEILLNPMGTIIIGAYGRVNMVLPKETVKLVLPNWNEWKIVTGIGNSMKLIEFNEPNIVKLFQDNLW
jgi:hypothetical protein